MPINNTQKKLLPHKFFESLSVTQKQVVLFLFVGGMNTVFGYSCFALFIYLGFHYVLAVAFATICGILFNFMTTGKVVFNNLKLHLIIKFICVYGFLYCVNVVFLKLLQLVSTNYYLTGFVTILPVAIIGFILNKYFVFRERHEIN